MKNAETRRNILQNPYADKSAVKIPISNDVKKENQMKNPTAYEVLKRNLNISITCCMKKADSWKKMLKNPYKSFLPRNILSLTLARKDVGLTPQWIIHNVTDITL
jgi:hypothetical protein